MGAFWCTARTRHFDHPEAPRKRASWLFSRNWWQRWEPAPVLFGRDSGAYMVTKVPSHNRPNWLPEDELSVVVSAATTSGRGRYPVGTGIRGTETPFRRIWSASGGGRRSASAAARSTTRPTMASPAKSQRRIPSPLTSISPASSGAGRTHNCPATVSRWTRSSPTRMAVGSCPARPARIRSKASRDLPAPEGPRISTA